MEKDSGAGSIRVMCPLFQGEEGGSIPTSALQLRLEPIDFTHARALNRKWHSVMPRFGTGFIANMPFLSFAAEFSGIIYGVGIWSNPEARNLPQQTWLELRRLAIAPDAPKNTASRMLRIMTMLIRRRLPKVVCLISYQDTHHHTGGIYRAAGWEQANTSAGGEWDRPNRSRPAVQSSTPKIRWQKSLSDPIRTKDEKAP